METCRTCGRTSLAESECEGLDRYASVYYCLTSLQLHDYENLSALRICKACVEKLLDYEKFRQLCVEVHWKLQLVKAEIYDEDQESDSMQYDYDDEKNRCITKDKETKPVMENNDRTSEALIPASLYIPSVEQVKDEFLLEDDFVPPKKKKRAKYGSTPKPPKPIVYNCDRCSEVFQDLQLFTAHERVHDGLKPFACDICVIDFETLLEMNMHNVQNHAQRKVLICDEPGCGEQFSSYQGLRSHRVRIHDPNYVPPAPSKPRVCICETCGETFRDKQKLTHHSYTHNPEDMPHVCTYCFRKFPRPETLRQHLMRHEGVRNFICPFCGVRKTTKNELRSHINNIHKLEQSALGDTKLESLMIHNSNLVNATSDTESPGPSSASQVDTKRARNESHWLKNIRKVSRNSGKAYVNKDNVEFKEKTFPKQYDCGCPKKCPTLFSSESVVEDFFTSFWKLSDWHKQNVLLTEMVKPGDVSRRRSTGVRSHKGVTFHYFVPDGPENKRVCKKYFLAVLQISGGRLYRCLGRRS